MDDLLLGFQLLCQVLACNKGGKWQTKLISSQALLSLSISCSLYKILSPCQSPSSLNNPHLTLKLSILSLCLKIDFLSPTVGKEENLSEFRIDIHIIPYKISEVNNTIDIIISALLSVIRKHTVALVCYLIFIHRPYTALCTVSVSWVFKCSLYQFCTIYFHSVLSKFRQLNMMPPKAVIVWWQCMATLYGDIV